MRSFIGSGFFFIFNLKKEQKLTSKINKLKYFHLKGKLSQVSNLAWLAIGTPGIRKCNPASNYILIFGKLFHICKLIHMNKNQEY